MSNIASPNSLHADSVHAPLREKWAWMVAFGALLEFSGIIALTSVMMSTIASVLFVGVAMIASGVIEIVYAFAMKSWKKFFLWLLLGLLYVVGGVCVFKNPLLAAGFLTLLLGCGLVASGLVRLLFSFQLPADSARLLVGLSGLLTLVLGGVILAQWPASSLWTLGVFLGVDLMFAGTSWMGVGISLRPGASR